MAGGLLQATSLVYQGAFRVPDGTFGGSSFPYGGTALTNNPVNDSLFVVGHDWQQMVAEIRIPPIVNSTSLAALSTAPVLQTFVDVTEGRMSSILTSPTETVKVGGLLVDNGKLIVSVYDYYDGCACNAQTSHFVSGLTLSTTGDVQGPFKVGSLNPGLVAGYMTPIPAEWQAALGGSVITGSCCLAVVGRTSFGPSAFAFNPADLGSTPAPASPLVYYPDAHQTLGVWSGTWDGTTTLFNGTTDVKGAVLPQGTRSLLFFGDQGVGPFCYGAGVATAPGLNECFDPTDTSKGTHAYPYQYQVWAYDVLDLAAVKAGQRQPWDVHPYAVWSLTFPISPVGGNIHLGGAAYDPQTQRIYVSQLHADVIGFDPLPVIHVFQVVP